MAKTNPDVPVHFLLMGTGPNTSTKRSPPSFDKLRLSGVSLVVSGVSLVVSLFSTRGECVEARQWGDYRLANSRFAVVVQPLVDLVSCPHGRTRW